MKKFEIKEIRLENIKTYPYEVIDFSEGYNVIIGENGAGKSTILESIFLSLFGETVPGRRLVDMIRYGERQGKIVTKFTVDGSEYRIEDEITRRAEDRATQSMILVNETLNETIAEGKKAIETKIEEILEIDATTFISAVYASQGEIGKIVTSRASERKKLFDRLFQINRYEMAFKNLRKVEKIIETKLKIMENRTTDLRVDLKQLDSLNAKIIEKEEQLKQEKSKLADSRKNFREVDQRYQQIKKFVAEYNILLGEKETLRSKVEELDEAIDALFELLKRETGEEKLICSFNDIQKMQKKYENEIEKIKETLESLREEKVATTRNLEKIRSKEETLETLNENIAERKIRVEEEKEQFRTTLPELGDEIDSWIEELPIILQSKRESLLDLKKKLRALERHSKDLSKKEAQLKVLEQSATKYNSRIVKKRLRLSEEVGEDWQESFEVFSKIDFEAELIEIKSIIEELEKRQIEISNKKSTIEANLKRLKEDFQHLASLKGEETCPTCKQKLSAEILERLCDEISKESNKLQEAKENRSATLGNVNKELAEARKKEDDLISKQRLYEKIAPTFKDLLELEKEKKNIENELKKLEEKIKKVRAKYSEEKEEQIKEATSKLERIIHTISDAKRTAPKLLKEREKILEDTGKVAKIEKELAQLKATFDESVLKKLDKKIIEKEDEQLKFAKVIEQTKNLINNLQNLEANKAQLENNSKKISEIEALEGFKQRAEIERQWRELDNDISSRKTTVKDLKEEIIPPLLEQKRNLQKKAKDLEDLEAELAIEQKKRQIVSTLRSLMRELPSRLLPNYIGRISETASEILRSVIPGSDIQGIVINPDYSLKIVRLGDQEDSSVLSGGETIVIALAIRLAFAKEFSSLDALILDEPTIFLDERRRAELVSVLEKDRLVGQMLVVTHDSDFERIADKTYYIDKVRGASSIKSLEDDTKDESESEFADFRLV